MSPVPPSPCGPSAVDGVMAGVLSKIVDESIAAGVTLPPETELAARFEVSQLAVREAIKTMSEWRAIHKSTSCEQLPNTEQGAPE